MIQADLIIEGAAELLTLARQRLGRAGVRRCGTSGILRREPWPRGGERSSGSARRPTCSPPSARWRSAS